MMAIIVWTIGLAVAAIYFFMRHPSFGKAPTGERRKIMEASRQYKSGQFHNRRHTPTLTEGVGYYTAFKEFFFAPKKRNRPKMVIPAQKTNLLQLSPEEDVLVWFGHSSYFLQLDGKKILVDPVLSGNASPVRFTTRSFQGSDMYTTDDLPAIDYLFITHDHWDHLDYKTVRQLRDKVGRVITGLGVGAHLEHWGYAKEKIIEKDWHETVELADGFRVHTTPARHFSGRAFRRNATLWMSFVLLTPTHRVFIGGDSGYDDHFGMVGENFGPFDLAILENGQYDKNWKYIHMMPEEVVQAALDLRAQKLLPVHWSKFALANHDWDEPIIKITDAAREKELQVLTPYIGEAVDLRQAEHRHLPWWTAIK